MTFTFENLNFENLNCHHFYTICQCYTMILHDARFQPELSGRNVYKFKGGSWKSVTAYHCNQFLGLIRVRIPKIQEQNCWFDFGG